VFDDMVISGGNFHGMPLSIAAANLFNAFCGTVAINMSLVRRIVDKDKNRLGVSCLISPEANHSISSGMMILEYSHTAHGNLLLSKNNTAFLHAQSSASHQEDHVSHAPTVILNMRDAIELHSVQLALQASIIRQGYYVLEKMENSWKEAGKIPQDAKMVAGTTGKTLIENMKDVFPVVTEDRYMQDEVEKVRIELIESDKLYDLLA
jgi:histidine ammonia-lyase